MSPFKKPKKSELLNEKFKRIFRKRNLIRILFSMAGLGLSLYLLVYLLERSMQFQEAVTPSAPEATPYFDREGMFRQAVELIKRAEAHEYRGRKDGVLKNYYEALKLLDEIKDKAPDFRPGEVESKIMFCENKIRKAK